MRRTDSTALDFGSAALAVIGLAAGVAGTKLFRWEAGRRMGHARWWVAAALTSWAAVGAIAWATGRLQAGLARSGSMGQYHGGANRGNRF